VATVRARLLEGDRPGTVVEADAEVAQQWVFSGKAELVGVEQPETPERVARKTRGRPGVETR